MFEVSIELYLSAQHDWIFENGATAFLVAWWHKLEQKKLSISQLFEEVMSWNSESKLITPKYITVVIIHKKIINLKQSWVSQKLNEVIFPFW